MKPERATNKGDIYRVAKLKHQGESNDYPLTWKKEAPAGKVMLVLVLGYEARSNPRRPMDYEGLMKDLGWQRIPPTPQDAGMDELTVSWPMPLTTPGEGDE